MNALANRAMNQYKQVGTIVGADSSDPHHLIVMLFDGVLERIAVAKGAMSRNEVELKGQKIGRAIAIIDGLRASLYKDQGGEVAENLDNLYDYMQRRLLSANVENNLDYLDEVSSLILEIKTAWLAIPAEMRAVAHS